MDISVTPHECHGVSNRRELDCLFNSLQQFYIQENFQISHGNTSVADGFLSQMAGYAESFLGYYDMCILKSQ